MQIRLIRKCVYGSIFVVLLRERPYQHDSTASRLLSEVKHARARLVLRWGTTLESRVLFSFHFDFDIDIDFAAILLLIV